ncbi:S-adenosyl-L-methionine-dependent methyltransferase [Zopfochytrium polystomum]|nr:S-adenosyl-L-methionine-dependent methyltransferase [Zopfochytrium polystomum]
MAAAVSLLTAILAAIVLLHRLRCPCHHHHPSTAADTSTPPPPRFDPLAPPLPAPTTPAEHHARARALQSLYCVHLHPPSPTGDLRLVRLRLDGLHPDPSRRPTVGGASRRPSSLAVVPMYVTSGTRDVVSHWVAGGGGWERDVSAGILAALAEGERVGHQVGGPLFVDVGSNLGVHSVAALAFGYRVVSIDAMAANAHAFLATLCETSGLAENSTFIAHGLGAEPATCAIASEDGNVRDGTVTCDPSAIALYRSNPRPAGLLPFRQWLRLAPLDFFLDEDAWVLKMDVEGFELDVLRGASRLFASRRVYYLVTEVMGEAARGRREKCGEMLVTLRGMGFSCSEEGWYGRRWAIPERAEDVVLKDLIYNRQHCCALLHNCYRLSLLPGLLQDRKQRPAMDPNWYYQPLPVADAGAVAKRSDWPMLPPPQPGALVAETFCQLQECTPTPTLSRQAALVVATIHQPPFPLQTLWILGPVTQNATATVSASDPGTSDSPTNLATITYDSEEGPVSVIPTASQEGFAAVGVLFE